MTTQITLKELARILNLAPSTVSRALKGHPDISHVTRKRVMDLARQLHYRPSVMAMGLRNRKFHLIAVIIPELTDFFYASALQGMVEGAYEKGYKLVVFESQEKYEKEVEICLALEKSGIDGLLISPAKGTIDGKHIESLKANDLPIVFYDRILGNIDVDRVMEDDYYGACIAMNHLIESGCRTIAHLAASQQWVWAQKRQMGYIQALLDHHMAVNRNLIVECRDLKDIDQVVRHLIDQHGIDGIFAVNDRIAVNALLALKRLGYDVPGRVAVCGYGNEPISLFGCPSLTTVGRNGVLVGKVAVELLMKRIETKKSQNTETRLLKTELIIRESTNGKVL